MAYVKSPVELGLRTDCQGIYIQTTDARIEAMESTGFLEFGVGDTRVDAEYSTIASRMRGHTSSKNPAWQQHLLDSIPNPGYRDYRLHGEIRQTFAAQLIDPDSGKRNELFRVAVDKMLIEQFVKSKDFEPVRKWLNEKIRRCAANLNPNHEKQSVTIRNIQALVINKVLSSLRDNGVETNFVCELAARIGKTILFLELAKSMHEEFGHQSMVIMAYGVGLSVRTSYKNEIAKYNDFVHMAFVDASEPDAEKQYHKAVESGRMPVVFVSLNPEVEEKYEWINQLAGTNIALLEETDFGTHTDSQVEKVEYILDNKTVTRINASGTNIGRLAKAFGKNVIDEIISVPYCMVEQDPSIPNVVVRRFYNMLFSGRINKLLEDFDQDLLPNITKILSKPLSQQKFISALFQDIFGYQPIYGFNISDCAGEEIRHSMLFVGNIGNDSMDQLAEVIEKACSEHKVLVLNGEYTTNKEAEGLTKEELVRLQNGYYEGRDKLLVITNMMGTRSYSIPEIQACLFMQEGGDVYPYMQKYSRCLTPGFDKKHGHIFDFAFDQSKTRNTVMSVAVEAALLIRQKGKTYPEAVREVLNSVNIKDMVTGQWIDADDVIRQFEDNDKLLEIANAHTRITIEDLTQEEIEAFGELAKRSSGSKAEKSKIDQTVAIGKTFESGNKATGRPKKDPLKAIVEKAIRMINGSATTVLALSNYQGESFLECVDIIGVNKEMSSEFMELYGVRPDTIKRLAHRLEISTLDMIVMMSKYNNSQKHIENNALAILKDDAKLWSNIFLNRELKRHIKSRHCKSILVIAGGHGSEIDVLVHMFGIDIVDKIVYNDKYSFLCNQIKRRYPGITVMQGDFIELEFDMKFDVVVGNPPYQSTEDGSKRKKMWVQFAEKAIDMAEYVAFVTPSAWQKENSKYFTGIAEKIKSKLVAYGDANSYFTVGEDIGYWIIDNNTSCPISVVDNNPCSPIYNKMLKAKGSVWHYRDFQQPHVVENGNWLVFSDTPTVDNTVPIYWTAKQVRYCRPKDVKYAGWKVIVNNSGHYYIDTDPDKYSRVDNSMTVGLGAWGIKVDSEQEGLNVLSWVRSKLYRVVVTKMKTGGFNNPFIELESLGTSKMWTDAEIYKHFGLTQEEIDYIEANVK
jgi:hypothetical protein